MPGKIGSSGCSRKRAIRFSRISSFTRRERSRLSEKELARNSPNVRALLMVGTPRDLDWPVWEPAATVTLCGLYAARKLSALSRQLSVFLLARLHLCSSIRAARKWRDTSSERKFDSG